MTTLSLDFETASEVPLVGASSVGLMNYMRHPSTRALMLAYCWNDDTENVRHIDFTNGEALPSDVREALKNSQVQKWCYNASFERLATRYLLDLQTPYEGWRCTMFLAYMRSFKGGLEDVGAQLGLPEYAQKDANGKRLIRMFSQPQKVTKNQPHEWRDRETDPQEWAAFCDYNVRDVIAETEVKKKLIGYPILDSEWELYVADQEINDRGLPVNRRFVENANIMAERRKAELLEEMSELTGLRNPNSNAQILPWLQNLGYRWEDLQKNTVAKALEEHANDYPMHEHAFMALKLRQQASKTSVKKYPAILRRLDRDDNLCHTFQIGGASRTNRWAGRGPQPQNLTRTPKIMEGVGVLESTTQTIADGDYETLSMLVPEPMTALSGLIRSSFQTKDDEEFVVCDLSAIESAVIAWLSGCKRMLRVFRDDRDPYKDFGTLLYNKLYDEITKAERTICKPPTLGCGFGLGPGREVGMKKTGLLGYAEAMGVKITQEQAFQQVKVFRTGYPEVPVFWQKLADACERACRGLETTVNGLLHFTRRGPFMTMELPSGRLLFYYKPMMKEIVTAGRNGEPWKRDVFTAMGTTPGTNQWRRVAISGPKACENAVQATAREVLKDGVLTARRDGFPMVGTVHDEIIAKRKRGDNRLSLERLKECMTQNSPWAKRQGGLPLKAAGYIGQIYKKD